MEKYDTYQGGQPMKGELALILSVVKQKMKCYFIISSDIK